MEEREQGTKICTIQSNSNNNSKIICTIEQFLSELEIASELQNFGHASYFFLHSSKEFHIDLCIYFCRQNQLYFIFN